MFPHILALSSLTPPDRNAFAATTMHGAIEVGLRDTLVWLAFETRVIIRILMLYLTATLSKSTKILGVQTHHIALGHLG